MYLYQLLFFYILGIVLEYIQKCLLILSLNFLEHFFTLSIQISANIKLLLLCFLLIFLLFDFRHLLCFCIMISENIVKISFVNIHIFSLRLWLLFFQQLDIYLHALFYTVVSYRPSPNNSIIHLSLLYSHDKIFGTLSNTLLKILKQLLSILAKINVDSLCLCL